MCGEAKHITEKDIKHSNKSKCINCFGDHFCFNNICPQIIKADEIRKIMANDNINYFEALKKINKPQNTKMLNNNN